MKYIKSLLAIATVALLGSSAQAADITDPATIKSLITASGATPTIDGKGGVLLTYTSTSSTGSLTVPTRAKANILVVGGGGGGGAGSGSALGTGGNGADVNYQANQTLAANTSLAVKVGKGGNGGTGGSSQSDENRTGKQGDPSQFGTIEADGGTGGQYKKGNKGTNGSGYGEYEISGTPTYYGAGGSAGSGKVVGQPGSSNTGNGGQGGGTGDKSGGNGGSGIVIVRITSMEKFQETGAPQAIVFGTPTAISDSDSSKTAWTARSKDEGVVTVSASGAAGEKPVLTGVALGTTTVTVENATSVYTYEVTVSKATPTVTAVSATPIMEGQTLSESTLTGTATGVGGAAVEGEWTWLDGTIEPTAGDSETTPYEYVFTPESGNYCSVTGETTLVIESGIEPTVVAPMPVGGAPFTDTVTGGEATTEWTLQIAKGADVVSVSPAEFTGESISLEIAAIAPGAAKVYVRKDGQIVKVYELTVLPTFNVTVKATQTKSVTFTNVFEETYTELSVAGDTSIASASWGETTEVAPGETAEITITGLQAGKTAALTLTSDGETIGYINVKVEYYLSYIQAAGLLTARDYTVTYTNVEGIVLDNLTWDGGTDGRASLEFSPNLLDPDAELQITIHSGDNPGTSLLHLKNGDETVCDILADVDYPATNAVVKMVAGTVVTNLYHNDTGVKLTGIHLNAPIEPSGVIESTRFLADDVEKDGDVAYEIVAGTACGTTAKATFDVGNMEVHANFGSVTVTVVPVATPSIDLFVTMNGSVAFTNLTSSVMDELEVTSSNPLVATGSLGDVKSIAVDEEIEIGVYALDLTGDATLTLTSRGQTVAQIAVTVGYDQKFDSKTVIAGRPVQFVYENETGAALTNLAASSDVALSDVSIAADGSVSFVIPNTATTATTKTYELKNNGVTIATYTVTTTAAPNLIEKDGIKHPIGNVQGTDPNKDYTFSQKDPSDIADLAFEKTSTYQANVFAIGKNQGRVTLVAQYQRSGGSLKDCGTFDILVYEETVQTNEVVMGSASEITFTSGVAGEWVAWSENPTVAKVTVSGSGKTCSPVITGLTPNAKATLHVENDYARYTIEVFVEEPALDPVRETVYVAEDGFAKTVVLTNETASESWTAVVSQGAKNATASAQKIDNDYAELTITGKQVGAARVKLRNAADAVQKIYEVVVSPLLTAQMEATKTATVTPAVAFDDVTSDDVAEAVVNGSTIEVTGKAVGTTTLLVKEDGVIVSYIDVTVGYTVTELEAISMKTSETKSFTYENNEGIVLTGLTLESDDESVATGLVEVASIGIDASQAFTVFPAGTPGKATLTLKSNGNTVATVEVTVAYPETDKTDEVKTLYGGEKDVTIAYANDTGFDLNALTVVSGDKNVATGLVASAVAKDGTATITVFGETAGTVELTLKNGDETIAHYTVFVVPRIPVTVNASETTNGVEYVNSFTNELRNLTCVATTSSSSPVAEAKWTDGEDAVVTQDGKGFLDVTGLMATNDVTFVLKSGEMTIGYLDVAVGYHLEELEPVALKTSDDPYVFNFTNVQGIALLNFATVSTNEAVATVAPATGTVEKDGSIDLTVTPAGAPGETRVEIYDGEYLIGTRVFTTTYPVAKGTNTLAVGTSVTNVWTNDTGFDLDALTVSGGDAVTVAIVGGVTSVSKGGTVKIEITAGNTAGPALVLLKNNDETVARYGVQVVPILKASVEASKEVELTYDNATGMDLDDLRDAADAIATATWAQPKWVEEDGSIKLTVKGLQADKETRLTLKSGDEQVVGYIDVSVGYPTVETNKVALVLEDGSGTATFTYVNKTGLTLDGLTVESDNEDAVLADLGGVTSVGPNGELVVNFTSSIDPGTATVTVKSGERVISVLVVTAGIKQEEKPTANLTLKVNESITYTTFSKSTEWTATSASTTYVTASVQNPTADEPECGKIVITGKTATGNTPRNVTIKDADGKTVKTITVTVLATSYSATGLKVGANDTKNASYGTSSTSPTWYIRNKSTGADNIVTIGSPDPAKGKNTSVKTTGKAAGDASFTVSRSNSDNTSYIATYCFYRVWEEKAESIALDVGRTIEMVCESVNPAVWSLDDLGDAANYVDVTLSNTSEYVDRVKLTIKAKQQWADAISFSVRNDYAEWTVTLKATPVPAGAISGSAITYGETLASSTTFSGTMMAGSTKVDGKFAWVDKTVAPTVADSGVTKYDVIFTPDELAKYFVTTNKATVTVNPKPITVTADDETIAFGETPELTYQITTGSLVGADTLVGTLTVDALTVGTHDIVQADDWENPNYAVTYVKGTLTVEKAPVELTDVSSSSGVNEGMKDKADDSYYAVVTMANGRYTFDKDATVSRIEVTGATSFTVSDNYTLTTNELAKFTLNGIPGTLIGEYLLGGGTLSGGNFKIEVGDDDVAVRLTGGTYAFADDATIAIPGTITLEGDVNLAVAAGKTLTYDAETAFDCGDFKFILTGEGLVDFEGDMLTVQENNYSAKADGEQHSATASVTEFVSAAATDPARTATVEYTTDGETWAVEPPAFDAVGEYEVGYRVTVAGIEKKTGTLTVKILKWDDVSSEEKIAAGDPTAFTLTSPLSETWTVESSAPAKVAVAPASGTGKEFTFTMTGANAGDTAVVTVRSGTYTATYNVTVVAGEENENITIIPGTTVSFATVLRATGGAEWKMTAAYLQGDESNFEISSEPVNGSLNVSVTGVEAGGLVRLSLRRTTASAIEKTIVVKVAEKEADETKTGLKVGEAFVTQTGSTGVKSDKWCYKLTQAEEYVTVEENDRFDYTAEFTVTAVNYSGDNAATIEIYYNAEDPADPAAILLKTVTVKTAVEGILDVSTATTELTINAGVSKSYLIKTSPNNFTTSINASGYVTATSKGTSGGTQTLLTVNCVAGYNSSTNSTTALVVTCNVSGSAKNKIAVHAYGPLQTTRREKKDTVFNDTLTWSSNRYWSYSATGNSVEVTVYNGNTKVNWSGTYDGFNVSASSFQTADFKIACNEIGQSEIKLNRTQKSNNSTVLMRWYLVNVWTSEEGSDEIQLVQGGDSRNVHTLYTPTTGAGSAWEVSSLDESVATVTCNSGAGTTRGMLTVTARNAGTTKIFASNGVLEYTLDLTVKPFDVTITVIPDNVTKCYGDPDNLTYTIDGLPDGVNVLEGTHLLREAGEDVDGGKRYLINLGDLQLDDPNYSLTLDATPKYLTITQKCVTVVADAGQSKVYGEADPTLTYTTEPAKLGNGGDIVLEGALTRESGETVGEYDILQGTVDNDEGRNPNYTIVGFESAKFAITKAQYDMKDVKVANGGKVTYNGEGQTVTLEGLPAGVTIASVVFTGLESMPTNAGVYEATVTFAVSDPDTYDVPEAQTFDLEIEKATITSATIKSVEFDGQEHAPEVTEVKAGELIVPEDSYEVEDVKFEHYGTHSVRIDAAAEGNFKGSVFADFYISKAVYDMSGVVFTNETYLYDGQPHKIVLGGTLPEGVACTSVTETAYIDVGEYTYTAKFAGDEDHEPIEDMTAVLTIRAGKVTVNGKAYDDIEAAMAELRTNGGTAVFNEEVGYAAFTFEEDTTLTVADGAWFVTNNLTVAETTVTNDISVAEKLTLAGNVTVGSDDAEAMLAFGSIDVGDYKLTLTTNGVVQSRTQLDISAVFAEVEHFHVAEKATTGGYEYTLVATEFYVKYYDGSEVVHSNKFTILNYTTDLHIWNGQRDDLDLVGYTREDGTTPLAVTDEALRDYIKDEAEDQGCDGEVKVLGTWKEIPKTFDITIAIMDCVTDVQTNGESVVGKLTLPADATEVELELVSTNTIPVFKFSTDGGSTWSVTNKTPVIAVAAGDVLTFKSEEAEMDDPDVTDEQAKQAIIDAIDLPKDPEDLERYVKAVDKVETVAGDGADQVPPKELATWITDNGVKSADLAESDYVVASVKFDTEKPITAENTEVEFTEVETATSDEFVFTIDLKIDDVSQDLTLVKEYVASCIQTTGDLGTGFETTVDASRVMVDSKTGKVTITPDPAKTAEFFKIVIPKDPGAK